MTSTLDSADNAWVLASGALVMLMTPGVGFFYGGMVNKKNVLSTIAYCMVVFSITSILWALIGFSLAFGPSSAAVGFIGDCTYCGLRGFNYNTPHPSYGPTITFGTFFFFQMMFATITPALMIGSIVGRIRFTFLVVFTVCWILVVYCPIAHWMWNINGWAFKFGVLDFAGGNVVHISSGTAGLASAIYLGKKRNIQKQTASSISLTLIGVSMLWFGWFGFNGGSALASNVMASIASINTHLAAAAAGLSWITIQYIYHRQLSILGWCSGAVCGMVGITPAAGYVSLWSSIIIGIFSGIFSYLFCHYKSVYFHELEDTLDVFGCHGVSGIWGGIATGLFATTQANPNSQLGAFYGNGRQLGVNLVGVIVSGAYSFTITLILYILLGLIMEVKVSPEQENKGLDVAIHGEQHDPITGEQVRRIIDSVKNFDVKSQNKINLPGNSQNIIQNPQQKQQKPQQQKQSL